MSAWTEFISGQRKDSMIVSKSINVFILNAHALCPEPRIEPQWEA